MTLMPALLPDSTPAMLSSKTKHSLGITGFSPGFILAFRAIRLLGSKKSSSFWFLGFEIFSLYVFVFVLDARANSIFAPEETPRLRSNRSFSAPDRGSQSGKLSVMSSFNSRLNCSREIGNLAQSWKVSLFVESGTPTFGYRYTLIL